MNKLFKYEFKSTARHFLLLYAIVLGLSIINRVLLELTDSFEINAFSLFFGLSTILFIFSLIALFIMTVVIIIRRFYKNLLGDEGYLSFTLPVTATQHILSKYITAIVWQLASIVVFIIALFIAFFRGDLENLFSNIRNLIATLGTNISFIILFLTMMFSTMLMQIMTMYTSISLGSIMGKKRVLMSFIYYFIIYFIIDGLNVGFTILTNSKTFYSINEHDTTIRALTSIGSTFFIIEIIFCIVVTAILFFVTKQVLEKKLNLQ